MGGRQIGKEIRRLQNELISLFDNINANDISKLRDEIIQLKRTMADGSNEFSSYDLEHYNKDIMGLLKQIQEKEKNLKALDDGNKKKFQFERKVKNVNMKGKSIMTAVNSLTTKTIDENIVISNNVTILQNLESCQVSTSLPENDANNGDSKLKKMSGSITISQVEKSCIELIDIPFDIGNIFITDCIQTSIQMAVPPNDKIQVRLHNLSNCSISIYVKQSSLSLSGTESEKQTVIIENIKDCIFDTKSKSVIDIQNFSHINGDSDDKKDYTFASIGLNNSNNNNNI